MAIDDKKRWRCAECGKITLERDLLTARNPFDENDTLCGCPNCRQVECFTEVCDEPGCEAIASCGFPTMPGDEWGGYRRTCYKHSLHQSANIELSRAAKRRRLE